MLCSFINSGRSFWIKQFSRVPVGFPLCSFLSQSVHSYGMFWFICLWTFIDQSTYNSLSCQCHRTECAASFLARIVQIQSDFISCDLISSWAFSVFVFVFIIFYSGLLCRSLNTDVLAAGLGRQCCISSFIPTPRTTENCQS